jgi:mono/diheme cytochrome c family protein
MKIACIVFAVFCIPAAYAAGNAQEGKTVYTSHCMSCHGATGVANPKIVKMMKTEIPFLGSPTVQKMDDSELAKVVTGGKGKMPPIHSVTGKAVDDVVAYLRTFKK